MKACVKRILEQYDALQIYFTKVAFEDSTNTHDAILASLKNKFYRIYVEFMDFNLGKLLKYKRTETGKTSNIL